MRTPQEVDDLVMVRRISERVQLRTRQAADDAGEDRPLEDAPSMLLDGCGHHCGVKDGTARHCTACHLDRHVYPALTGCDDPRAGEVVGE